MNDEKLESTCMQIDADLASGANFGLLRMILDNFG